jgi:hypothetical protein
VASRAKKALLRDASSASGTFVFCAGKTMFVKASLLRTERSTAAKSVKLHTGKTTKIDAVDGLLRLTVMICVSNLLLAVLERLEAMVLHLQANQQHY